MIYKKAALGFPLRGLELLKNERAYLERFLTANGTAASRARRPKPALQPLEPESVSPLTGASEPRITASSFAKAEAL